MLKKVIKNILPPILLQLARIVSGKKENTGMWTAVYKTWAEAKAKAMGYDAKNILGKVLNSSRMIRDGKAIYERDSVLFDKISYPWPLLSILQKIASENNNALTIIDFGGSLGSTYFQTKKWLEHISIKWIIIEQSHFVEIGKAEFQNDNLFFELSLNEAVKYKPDIILFSSVLQYLENPQFIIEEAKSINIKHIILDRTSINSSSDDIFTLQEVPAEIYKASYPCRIFNEENLVNYFIPQYQLITDFESYCDPSFINKSIKFSWKGYFFKIN